MTEHKEIKLTHCNFYFSIHPPYVITKKEMKLTDMPSHSYALLLFTSLLKGTGPNIQHNHTYSHAFEETSTAIDHWLSRKAYLPPLVSIPMDMQEEVAANP